MTPCGQYQSSQALSVPEIVTDKISECPLVLHTEPSSKAMLSNHSSTYNALGTLLNHLI